VPAIVTAWVLYFVWRHQDEGVDFHLEYWVAGMRLLHGLSPYALHSPNGVGWLFVYPPVAAFAFTPFALLPDGTSSVLYTAMCIALAALTLRVVGVRDWRLYGMTLMLGPVVNAWQVANVTLPLAFGLAVMWRYRDRPVVAGLAAAAIVSLKPVVWPAVVWLLVTRRFRAAAYGVAACLGINLVAFALVGFDQISAMVRAVNLVTKQMHHWGYSVIALAGDLGVGYQVGIALTIAISAALLVTCYRAGRTGRDAAALVLTVDLALAASPLVWVHYLALMIVPLAVVAPTLSLAWFLQIPLWICPVVEPHLPARLLVLVTLVSTTYLLLRDADGVSELEDLGADPQPITLARGAEPMPA
jgi:hypothetical protein